MKKDKPQMLNRLINTLRKRGAQGRSFPVQASEAIQAAELIAEVVAQRDALLQALKPFAEVDLRTQGVHHNFASQVLSARATIKAATGNDI